MLGSPDNKKERSEAEKKERTATRATTFPKLETEMVSRGYSWSDIGNLVEDNYTKTEMQECAAAAHREGVEAGIKVGMALAASNGRGAMNGNGSGYQLPKIADMVEHCHQQVGRLKNDNERDFIDRVYLRRRTHLSLSELGFLMSVYAKSGGKIT